jgi:hypothetical protein
VKGVIAGAKAKKATKASIWIVAMLHYISEDSTLVPHDTGAWGSRSSNRQRPQGRRTAQVPDLGHQRAHWPEHQRHIACKGTQTDRSVQDMFVNQAPEKIEHLIKDPHGEVHSR